MQLLEVTEKEKKKLEFCKPSKFPYPVYTLWSGVQYYYNLVSNKLLTKKSGDLGYFPLTWRIIIIYYNNNLLHLIWCFNY